MKKISFFIFNTILSIALAVVAFCCLKSDNNLTSAETIKEATATTNIFTYLSITQEDYAFSEDDLVKTTLPNQTTEFDTIYTNKTISIEIIYNLSVWDNYTIVVNGNNITNDYIEVNKTKYHVLDISQITEDTANVVAIDFQINGRIVGFKFLVIQTKDNFQINDNLYWEYGDGATKETVKAPTNNATYPEINLFIPNGTELNPIYVRFNYLGKNYLVYNIDGEFYNSFNDDKLNFDHLSFNQSGAYVIEVFDKTYYSYPNANYNKYSFSVKSKTSPFYIHAVSSKGTTITNGQIANHDTTIKFVNINDIISSVDRVVITKSWRPTGSENVSEETVYKTNFPTSVVLNGDGTYNIQVIAKNGNIIYNFDFILLKDIRTFFEKDGSRYEIGANEPANISRTFTIPTTIDSSYGDIYGETTYSFSVTIAKSAPTITGIDNNARTQKSVSLVVRGVGTIDVAVTQDGETSNLKLTNGQRIQTLTEPGKYFVKITDEMGTTVTKSFTITVKMNTASIVLLVIAAVVLVVFIVMIIVSRTKIKVR